MCQWCFLICFLCHLFNANLNRILLFKRLYFILNWRLSQICVCLWVNNFVYLEFINDTSSCKCLLSFWALCLAKLVYCSAWWCNTKNISLRFFWKMYFHFYRLLLYSWFSTSNDKFLTFLRMMNTHIKSV